MKWDKVYVVKESDWCDKCCVLKIPSYIKHIIQVVGNTILPCYYESVSLGNKMHVQQIIIIIIIILLLLLLLLLGLFPSHSSSGLQSNHSIVFKV